MLINAQLRSKQEEIQPVRCDIACIVELSNAEFYDFQFNPLADHDFIKAHLPDLKTDEFHAIPCMLVLGEGVDDGDFVIADGSGVVFIRQADLVRVLDAAEVIAAREAAMVAALRAGEPITQVMGATYETMLEAKP